MHFVFFNVWFPKSCKKKKKTLSKKKEVDTTLYTEPPTPACIGMVWPQNQPIIPICELNG